jgi:hypothetical protein
MVWKAVFTTLLNAVGKANEITFVVKHNAQNVCRIRHAAQRASLTARGNAQSSIISWPPTYLTPVFLGLEIVLDFSNDVVNILLGIARLHIKEVSHRLLAFALRHPGLLDQFFKHNLSA